MTTRLIEWTGERCVPWTDDVQIVYEHLHRYHFAAPYVDSKRVLDLGSGEGYGAALLARTAAEVVGVDIDPASVEHSRRTYDGRPNLTFLEGSIADLGRFEAASFDVAVCFETIEHVDDHEAVVDEIARVLTPDGLLFLSTPDRDVYSPAGRHNPFHARELNRSELTSLLARSFSEVAFWGQTASAGSFMRLLEGAAAEDEVQTVFVARDDENGWAAGDPPPPTYLVAVAGRTTIPLLPATSALVDPAREVVAVERRERDEQARLAQERDRVLRAMLDSTSWRLTAPLRWLKARLVR